ncbi:hypothetical protein WA538_000536, partial [Blastocystis sp. DL]
MSADTTLPSESHPLHNHYRFWRTVNIESSTENYESQLDDLGSCETVEQFWNIYCALPTIGSADTDNYYFFKDGIMPLWEDPGNKQGGRITLVLNGVDLTPYLWETLLMATIGEQFNVGREICGVSVTYKAKKNCSVLCVWNKSSSASREIDQIEAVLRRIWSIPQKLRFKYKENYVAMHSFVKTEEKPTHSEPKS